MEDSTIYNVGPAEVRGQEFPVTLQYGQFTAMVDGAQIKSARWSELVDKIMKATAYAATHVDVPFVTATFSGIGDRATCRIRRGKGTGVHGGNGNVMITWQDTGQSEQLTGNHVFLQAISQQDADEWLRLIEAEQAASRALRDFQMPRRLNLPAAVRAEVERRLELAAGSQGDGDGND